MLYFKRVKARKGVYNLEKRRLQLERTFQMTKEVLIWIKGSHSINEEDDLIEVIVPGNYYFKNGKHFLLYDEVIEVGTKPVHNVVKIGKDTIEITKDGQVQSKMQFEKGKTFCNRYMTPFGELMMGVETTQIQIQEEEDYLKAELDYALAMNYEHTSKCSLIMEVRSKEKADVKLSTETAVSAKNELLHRT